MRIDIGKLREITSFFSFVYPIRETMVKSDIGLRRSSDIRPFLQNGNPRYISLRGSNPTPHQPILWIFYIFLSARHLIHTNTRHVHKKSNSKNSYFFKRLSPFIIVFDFCRFSTISYNDMIKSNEISLFSRSSPIKVCNLGLH